MKSMTGFGRGAAVNDEKGIVFNVEISSVNRKQLEIRPSLPREISSYEPLLRSLISEKISRGYISVSVNLEMNPSALQKTVRINDALAMVLTKKCRNLKEKLELAGELQIGHILSLPGVVEAGFSDYNVQSLHETFIKAMKIAIEANLKMRIEEGERLKTDMTERIEVLKNIVEKLAPLAEAIPEKQRDKLIQKLKDAGLPLDHDDDRIVREIVIFADKSDVSEEITRLGSHISQFHDFLAADDKPVGRSLDFVTQEINREITTLGNKAADPAVSPLVVHFKTELEKIREQVQNIE